VQFYLENSIYVPKVTCQGVLLAIFSPLRQFWFDAITDNLKAYRHVQPNAVK
jgi:hypothetical protein